LIKVVLSLGHEPPAKVLNRHVIWGRGKGKGIYPMFFWQDRFEAKHKIPEGGNKYPMSGCPKSPLERQVVIGQMECNVRKGCFTRR